MALSPSAWAHWQDSSPYARQMEPVHSCTHGYSDNKVQGCYYPATDPLEADELLVAHSLVGLETAGWALHGAPVAVAVAAAPVVLAAQRAHVEAAVAVAARTLTANQR